MGYCSSAQLSAGILLFLTAVGWDTALPHSCRLGYGSSSKLSAGILLFLKAVG
jgi:hypothetical protein